MVTIRFSRFNAKRSSQYLELLATYTRLICMRRKAEEGISLLQLQPPSPPGGIATLLQCFSPLFTYFCVHIHVSSADWNCIQTPINYQLVLCLMTSSNDGYSRTMTSVRRCQRETGAFDLTILLRLPWASLKLTQIDKLKLKLVLIWLSTRPVLNWHILVPPTLCRV